MVTSNTKYFCSILVLFLSFCFVSASVSLNINQPTGTVEVTKDSSFNIQATISCAATDCKNIEVGLKIPNVKEVTYNFSEKTSDDCFGGTCLTKPIGNGPLSNSSGSINWGGGKCSQNPIWGGEDIRNLVTLGYISGMKLVAGKDLCVETDNGEKWDLKFSSWPAAGVGDFVYTRTRDEGLLGKIQNSLPFYVSSGQNPIILNLNAGESSNLNFSVMAVGDIGSYSNLVLFASDQEKPVNVNIIANTSDTPVEKTTTHHSSSGRGTSDSVIVFENNSYKENSNQEKTTSEETPITLTGKVIDKKESSSFGVLFWILVLVFLIVLFALIKLIMPKSSY